MTEPAEDLLPILACWMTSLGFLSVALCDGPTRERIQAVARRMPVDSPAIIEVRLAHHESRADFSARVTSREQALHLAAVFSPHRRESQHWAEFEMAGNRVPALWLELDLDPELPDLPPPLLIAQLPPEPDPLWLADTLLPALHGRPLTPAQRETVLSSARAVPPPARLLYAFSLHSRPGNAVRLEILGLGPAESHAYLSLIAPHTLPTLSEIAPLLAGTENPHLSFDIGEAGEILPRIGLEGAFPTQPPREPRWAELLSRWADLGLCSPEKRDAVLAWPGQDSYWTAPDRWPAEAGIGGRLVRFLSHVKVAGQPGWPPEAKAYLGFQYLP